MASSQRAGAADSQPPEGGTYGLAGSNLRPLEGGLAHRHMGTVPGPIPIGSPSFDIDVLVVDDDEAVRVTMAEILRREGYRVDEAHDGQSALERLREATVGVILLDLHMPRMDGHEVLARLTAQDPPVVIVSAYERTPLPPGCEATVVAYMRKPAKPDMILGAVADALDR